MGETLNLQSGSGGLNVVPALHTHVPVHGGNSLVHRRHGVEGGCELEVCGQSLSRRGEEVDGIRLETRGIGVVGDGHVGIGDELGKVLDGDVRLLLLLVLVLLKSPVGQGVDGLLVGGVMGVLAERRGAVGRRVCLLVFGRTRDSGIRGHIERNGPDPLGGHVCDALGAVLRGGDLGGVGESVPLVERGEVEEVASTRIEVDVHYGLGWAVGISRSKRSNG